MQLALHTTSVCHLSRSSPALSPLLGSPPCTGTAPAMASCLPATDVLCSQPGLCLLQPCLCEQGAGPRPPLLPPPPAVQEDLVMTTILNFQPQKKARFLGRACSPGMASVMKHEEGHRQVGGFCGTVDWYCELCLELNVQVNLWRLASALK